jgi:SAM-dependent methyltransferase
MRRWYEKHLLPHLIHLSCGSAPITEERARVVPGAHGRVAEIGIGSGLNLPHYDPSRVREVIGIEPSPEMRDKADKAARDVPFPVRLLESEGERLPLEDASMDTVVVTFTLCTIPDPVRAVREMRRVLRPAGQLLFAEHGQAPDDNVRRWQERLDPIWGVIGGGCHLARPIPRLLEEGGFRVSDLAERYVPGGPKFASYVYRGAAAPS